MTDHYQITIQTWKKLAEMYAEKFMDFNIYDESYEAFCSEIGKSDPSILEIGCGPGNVTRWLRKRLPKSTVLATDVATEMIEVAKTYVENVQFEVLDARDIDSLKEKFDAIMSGFCVLYLEKSDLESFIKNSASLLNEQGIIYLSFIEGDYSDSQIQIGKTGDSMKVHYYQESEVNDLFEANSIEPIQSIRVPYPLSDGSEQIHLILLGRKK
ncbi:MAG: SAM-dependent methyltransferase [Fluviicola sp.]|nr:MAG: SAM-dependent methyltransferase [Fluviicola sp.]